MHGKYLHTLNCILYVHTPANPIVHHHQHHTRCRDLSSAVDSGTGGRMDKWTGDHGAERQAKHVSGFNYVTTLAGEVRTGGQHHDMALLV